MDKTEEDKTGAKIETKIEVTVDRILFSVCGDGHVAYRASAPDKTFYGVSQHEAKLALLTHESESQK